MGLHAHSGSGLRQVVVQGQPAAFVCEDRYAFDSEAGHAAHLPAGVSLGSLAWVEHFVGEGLD